MHALLDVYFQALTTLFAMAAKKLREGIELKAIIFMYEKLSPCEQYCCITLFVIICFLLTLSKVGKTNLLHLLFLPMCAYWSIYSDSSMKLVGLTRTVYLIPSSPQPISQCQWHWWDYLICWHCADSDL